MFEKGLEPQVKIKHKNLSKGTADPVHVLKEHRGVKA
jgi:hypothetical protein